MEPTPSAQSAQPQQHSGPPAAPSHGIPVPVQRQPGAGSDDATPKVYPAKAPAGRAAAPVASVPPTRPAFEAALADDDHAQWVQALRAPRQYVDSWASAPASAPDTSPEPAGRGAWGHDATGSGPADAKVVSLGSRRGSPPDDADDQDRPASTAPVEPPPDLRTWQPAPERSRAESARRGALSAFPRYGVAPPSADPPAQPPAPVRHTGPEVVRWGQDPTDQVGYAPPGADQPDPADDQPVNPPDHPADDPTGGSAAGPGLRLAPHPLTSPEAGREEPVRYPVSRLDTLQHQPAEHQPAEHQPAEHHPGQYDAAGQPLGQRREVAEQELADRQTDELGPHQLDRGRYPTAQYGAGRYEAAQYGPERHETAQYGPEQHETAQYGSEQHETAQHRPEPDGAAQYGPEQREPAQYGPERREPAQHGPEQHEPVPFEAAQYEPDRHQADRYEANRHQADRHEVDRHEVDRHEVDRHEVDRHEVDRHEADRHEAHRHQPDPREFDRHDGDPHDGEPYDGEGHDRDRHNGDGYQAERYVAGQPDEPGQYAIVAPGPAVDGSSPYEAAGWAAPSGYPETSAAYPQNGSVPDPDPRFYPSGLIDAYEARTAGVDQHQSEAGQPHDNVLDHPVPSGQPAHPDTQEAEPMQSAVANQQSPAEHPTGQDTGVDGPAAEQTRAGQAGTTLPLGDDSAPLGQRADDRSSEGGGNDTEAARSAAPASAATPLRPGDVQQSALAVWSEPSAQRFRDDWHEVKALFVDEPVEALAQAGALVTAAVNEVTAALLSEQERLDPLRDSSAPDTETMRVAMRRYREFLDRILAL